MNETKLLLRSIEVAFHRPFTWKEHRSYLMSNSHKIENNKLVVKGYVRGEFLSTNRVIHISGCGNFKLEWIYVKNEAHLKKEQMESEILLQEEEK